MDVCSAHVADITFMSPLLKASTNCCTTPITAVRPAPGVCAVANAANETAMSILCMGKVYLPTHKRYSGSAEIRNWANLPSCVT